MATAMALPRMMAALPPWVPHGLRGRCWSSSPGLACVASMDRMRQDRNHQQPMAVKVQHQVRMEPWAHQAPMVTCQAAMVPLVCQGLALSMTSHATPSPRLPVWQAQRPHLPI